MTEAIAVEGLTKCFAEVEAVSGLSFSVQRGELFGFLGPNGAGKTTTINMILGVLEPTSGTVRIEGLDVAGQRSRALLRTNFAAVYAPLPGNSTVYQNLRFFGMQQIAQTLQEDMSEVRALLYPR